MKSPILQLAGRRFNAGVTAHADARRGRPVNGRRADYVKKARPAYVAAVTQLAECLMRAGSANDALRRYGPVAELLGSSAPAWPELDARLDVWLDTVREMDVKVWGCRRRGVNWFSGGT